MLAAFDHPRDQQQAIKALPRDMRLDDGDFEDEYECRLELHKQEKARKAETRSKVTAIEGRRPRLKPVR
jgi:hypothetical protein